jgi:hypothetical protein
MDFAENRPRGYWPVFKGDVVRPVGTDRGPGTYYAWATRNRGPAPAPEGAARHAAEIVGVHDSTRTVQQPESLRAMPAHRVPRHHEPHESADDYRGAAAPEGLRHEQGAVLSVATGHTRDEAYLLAVLSSLPLDWYARRFVETNVNFFILNPFPIPRRRATMRCGNGQVALAGRLAAVDDHYAEWAADVGVECGPVDGKLKVDMICELDAVVALLYGLDEKHLRHIFETFHEGWGPGQTATHPTLGEYDARLRTTLSHYRTFGKQQ